MTDFVTVESVEGEETTLDRSDYAQVLFHNIAETYPLSKDLECAYTVTALLTPTPRDWVALYKVGWCSAARDYVMYDYAPMPSEEQCKKDTQGKIVFKANKLPGDDGEFYQFCYVASTGQVRGASTPFQFVASVKSAAVDQMDEFIEIEDEDNDIMVIRSRTAVLEDDLNKALQEEKTMKKTVELLERERDNLLSKITDLETDLDTSKDERDELVKDLKLTQEKVALCHQESSERQTHVKMLQEQVETLKQEKNSIEERMNDNDTYVISLREKIKELVNTKDALMGRNKNLEEEKEMYKSNFSSSESTLTGYKIEIDNLQQRVDQQERNNKQLMAEIAQLRTEISEERKKQQQQMTLSQKDKAHIQELSEKLRNCEDKLLAAEECKQMLNEELDTQVQAYQKISTDLEKSRSEEHSLKVRMGKLEEASNKKEQSWNGELKYLQGKLEEKATENERLERETDSWRRKFEEMETEKKSQNDAPMFALQMAQKTLKERLAKKQAENEELKKMVDDLIARKKTWDQQDLDNKREIVGLKEHLLMGQESFRDKYIECQKLRADLKKAQKQRSASNSLSGSESKALTPQVSVESPVKRQEELIDGDSQTSLVVESSELLTNTEVMGQIDHLAEELEKRKAGKNKYKTLYIEEKEKTGALQKQFEDELKKRDEAMAKQQKRMDEMTQKQSLLQNKVVKMEDERSTLESEIERLMKIIESHGQNTQPPPKCFNYGTAPARVYSSGESALAPTEPLPLRFCNPTTYPPQTIPSNTTNPFLKQQISGQYVAQSSVVTPSVTSSCASQVTVSQPCPLPPPLQPELTAEAKKAALLAQIKGNKGSEDEGSSVDDDVTADDIFPNLLEAASVAPSAPPQEHESNDGMDDERFLDAPGDPQQLCPVCSMVFPAETQADIMTAHIESHYGPECPVCQKVFDNKDTERFQEHVNLHFED